MRMWYIRMYGQVWGRRVNIISGKMLFKPFQVDKDLIKYASEEDIIMHCLPAHRGEEISEDVLEGPKSVIWDQSENQASYE